MRILALEPYYGGSHRAFIDGLIGHSGHEWTLLTLPAYKWKWRMRHSAIAFADMLRRRGEEKLDLVFCSDMLNLAEFAALAPREVAGLPRVLYFHENQVTYPVRMEDERDYQYVMTNLTSALAADAVWFNSGFHREEFLGGLEAFLKSMPDFQPVESVEAIRGKSEVRWPGIEEVSPPAERKDGPLRILWCGRWEHDKNPEDFFAAMGVLEDAGVEFRLNVIGESFRDVPEVFGIAKEEFAGRIENWGYQEGREEYVRVLQESDVVVSTANHEFFGISILEAIAAGCFPVLPRRLAYPEILAGADDAERFLYDGSMAGLAEKLVELSGQAAALHAGVAGIAERFKWSILASQYDQTFEVLCRDFQKK